MATFSFPQVQHASLFNLVLGMARGKGLKSIYLQVKGLLT